MDYNTFVVILGLGLSGLLLGGFGALVSLKGENLTADVAGHGVVTGVVLSQGLVAWLGWAWLAVPALWCLGFASSALVLLLIFWLRHRHYSPGAAQALAIGLAYGSTLVTVSIVQGLGLFSTKGLVNLLLGDAATITLVKTVPMLAVAGAGLCLFLVLKPAVQRWILDPEGARLSGQFDSMQLLWVVSTVVVVLAALPALGLTLLVGALSLPALIVRPWVKDLGAFVAGSAAVGGLGAMLFGWISASLLPLPTGALVVVGLGLFWLASALARLIVKAQGPSSGLSSGLSSGQSAGDAGRVS